MKTRSIAIMIAILIVLGAVYYVDYHRKVEREAADLAQSQIVPFPKEKIDSISIVNSFGEFSLAKRIDGWWIVRPVVDHADQVLVQGKIIPELEKAGKSNPFEMESDRQALAKAKGKPPEAGEDYGLRHPKMQITIASSSEGRSVRLSIGDETPVKGEIYLVDEAEPDKVYTAPGKIHDIFDQDLTDLRDKTVLDAEPEQVTQFWIRRPADAISAQKQGNGQWAAELVGSSETLRSTADAMAVENLFRRIRAAKAENFVTTATISPALYGLDHPQITLELRQEDAASTAPVKKIAPRATLLIGDRTTSGNIADPLYFAMQRGRNAVFTVHQSLVDTLMRPVATFRDRRIFTMNPDDIQYLQIEALASSFALIRDRKGRWAFATDAKTRVDQDKVQSYINFCLRLRVEEELNPPITDASLVRLDKPMLRVTMSTGDRSIRQGFEIGGAPKGKPFFFARRSPATSNPEDAKIFLLGLPLTGFHALVKIPDFFVYKRLIAFETDTVARVVIESQLDPAQKRSAQLTLDRGDQETWNAKLNTGKATDIPANQVEVFLLSLQRVDYVDPAKEVSTETLKKEQLDAPPCVIRLYGSSNKLLGEVAFGDLRRAERIMVRAGSRDYYLVDTQSFAGVASSLSEIMIRFGS